MKATLRDIDSLKVAFTDHRTKRPYSFTIGTLPISISRTFPDAPKSIVAVARGPTPSHEITVPRPYLSWLTRSPTSSFSATVSFQPLPNDGVDTEGEDDERRPHVVAARGPDDEPELDPDTERQLDDLLARLD